jgi:hypothetical protein
MYSTTNEITNYSNFNPELLKFTKLEENDRSNGQLVGYVNYGENSSPLLLQLPWIKLFTYGIPTLGQYYKTDDDRSHLRLPLDPSIPEVADLINVFKGIDNLLSNPERMEQMLGKKSKKYRLATCFKEGQEQLIDEDDPKPKKQTAPRPPYVKLKLDLQWPSKEIKTVVYESVLDTATNKRTRTKVENIKSIDDFASIVRFLSTVRCIIRPVKVWAHSITKKDPEFGITFKLVKIEVENANKANKTLYKSLYESDNFIDSDTEEDLPKVNITQPSKLLENNSDSDSSEEVITKPTNTIIEVDSSDDSDEEIKVAPPVVTKTKKPVASAKSKK